MIDFLLGLAVNALIVVAFLWVAVLLGTTAYATRRDDKREQYRRDDPIFARLYGAYRSPFPWHTNK